jgi:hypothetical protein
MKLLTDYLARLDQILLEQAGDLDESGKEAAIDAAVREHSRYRPHRRLHVFSGDGSAVDFPLGAAPGPTDWEKEFSTILRVEYPAGRREPIYLEDEDWMVYDQPTGQVLRLLTATPGATEQVVVTYTLRHALGASSSTIADADFEALCHLGAAFALQSLSNRYLQTVDSTIGADAVDHKSKSFDAAQNAARERQTYFRMIGVKENDVAAAFASKDMDVDYPWGEDRLTHPRRWR